MLFIPPLGQDVKQGQGTGRALFALVVPAAISQAVLVLPGWGRLLSNGQPSCLRGRRAAANSSEQVGSSGLSSGSQREDIVFCLQALGA